MELRARYTQRMAQGISLANKCLLLFGIAVVVIVTSSMVVPWMRVRTIVDSSQLETSRQIARLVEKNGVGSNLLLNPDQTGLIQADDGLTLRFIDWTAWVVGGEETVGSGGAFDRKAREALVAARPSTPGRDEYHQAVMASGARRYTLAKIIYGEEFEPRGVLIISRSSDFALSLIFANRTILAASGLLTILLAIGVFYAITKLIVLGPVRKLRDTAERVREGNLAIRSDIRTRDEFEELSDAFNAMLENIGRQQERLRSINKSLDLRLGELAERNTILFETARLKGEFLASVSHELRTPLNSIIGFAEILRDILDAESEVAPDDEDEHTTRTRAKRRRYVEHIVNAGRGLLEMINELLTMAKIEAGRIELHIEPTNIGESCEGLVELIRPLADRKKIDLVLALGASNLPSGAGKPGSGLPLVWTDAQKLQQIVFNFLSNAVKFTPEGGSVTLRAERLIGQANELQVRISVLDTGPGIAEDEQKLIFEKFRQLEQGHTRGHAGTGLGLAIAKEFAAMLGGEIHLDSHPGRGSMFSVILPVNPAPEVASQPSPEIPPRAPSS